MALWICTSSYSLEKALQVHSAVGTCTMIWQRSFIPRYRDYSTAWTPGKSSPISCPSPCLCLCPCLWPCLCPCLSPCPCPFPCLFPCPCPYTCLKLIFSLNYLFFYFFIWLNEYWVRHGNYSAYSQGAYKLAWKLQKRLSHESGQSKSAENLGASPLERDLSVDTTFS
jgi:hypothetical protein